MPRQSADAARHEKKEEPYPTARPAPTNAPSEMKNLSFARMGASIIASTWLRADCSAN